MNRLLMVFVMGLFVVGGVALLVGASQDLAGKASDSALRAGGVKLPPVIEGKQDVFLRATDYGTYQPNYIAVKKGIPVRIHYSADPNVGCGREVVFPEFKQRKLAPPTGETLIEFTPTSSGKFSFHCPMNMFRGTIEVI